MASPPYSHPYTSSSAISPPYPSNAQLPQPQKRRQSDLPSSAPGVKRRKASILSTSTASSHPLRQTSFPPEASSQMPRDSRSPSVDTMSLVSGSVAGTTMSKRGRKKKVKAGAGGGDELGGGKGKSKDGADRAKSKRRQSQDISADEDEGGEEMAVQMAERTQEERQKDIEQRAMLVRCLDEDQFSRYEAWRSSRLSDAVVRRIVNQTLSQSAPATVILAVKSVAKIFAGEMIEGARRVQTQWLEASGESQTALPSPPADGDKPKEKESRRGPLLPDHLRESIRRYKAEGDGGLAGQLGLWQLQAHSGVERFGVKNNGRKLFK